MFANARFYRGQAAVRLVGFAASILVAAAADAQYGAPSEYPSRLPRGPISAKGWYEFEKMNREFFENVGARFRSEEAQWGYDLRLIRLAEERLKAERIEQKRQKNLAKQAERAREDSMSWRNRPAQPAAEADFPNELEVLLGISGASADGGESQYATLARQLRRAIDDGEFGADQDRTRAMRTVLMLERLAARPNATAVASR